jgi:maltose alpha-D-glucosyltransferase/alpha-amylase
MVELVAAARDRGIRVLLDLVAGHTSDQHPWFVAECHADGPSLEGDRYVWCEDPPLRDTTNDIPGMAAWVRSPGPRSGWYLKNFFDQQPALNFGWGQVPDGEPWRDPVDAPGPRRNRAALRDIMARAADRGEIAVDEPDLAAAAALGAVLQPAVFKLYGRLPGPLRDRAADLARAACGAVGARV